MNGRISAAGLTVANSVWTRQPPCAPHRPARLVHVLSDPRQSTPLRELHVKLEMRSDFETDHHDPWSAEFSNEFLISKYPPERHDSTDDVTQQILTSFHPDQEHNERKADAMENNGLLCVLDLLSPFVATRSLDREGVTCFLTLQVVTPSHHTCSVFSKICHHSNLLCAKWRTAAGKSGALMPARFQTVQLKNIFQDAELNNLEALKMLHGSGSRHLKSSWDEAYIEW